MKRVVNALFNLNRFKRVYVVFVLCATVAIALSAQTLTTPHSFETTDVADRTQPGADDGLRQAFERVAYSLEKSSQGTYSGVNSAQRLTLMFDGQEARLSHPDGSVNFHLTGYGYGDRLLKPARATVTGTGDRVEYRRGDLTEWYVNGSRGLEQGFTFSHRPETGGDGEPLVIALCVTGGLAPTQNTNGNSVLLESSKGVVLRYAGLTAVDARGRTLRSRLEAHGREIRLIIEDRSAQYPLVVDPLWTQQQELTAGDGAADFFRFSEREHGGSRSLRQE
jgi:trimeric autotransporter adhesin